MVLCYQLTRIVGDHTDLLGFHQIDLDFLHLVDPNDYYFLDTLANLDKQVVPVDRPILLVVLTALVPVLVLRSSIRYVKNT